MSNSIFNKTFFKFLLGFIGIILASLLFIVITGLFAPNDKTTSTSSQQAVETVSE